jgi:hypothetical protein
MFIAKEALMINKIDWDIEPEDKKTIKSFRVISSDPQKPPVPKALPDVI